MTSDDTTIDWQHPDVMALTIGRLKKLTENWRRQYGRGPDFDERDGDDIGQAMLFAGEKLDAYQMARFLEDSRGWPSDLALIGVLQTAPVMRDTVIKDVQKSKDQSAAKSAGDQYPVGFLFVGPGRRVWKIVGYGSGANHQIDPVHGTISGKSWASKDAIADCIHRYDQTATGQP